MVSKRATTRPHGSETKSHPNARVRQKFHSAHSPERLVEQSLSLIARATNRKLNPGAVAVQSGTATRGSPFRSGDPDFITGWAYHIPAPPKAALEVLWYTFEFYSQWWSWSAPDQRNKSKYYKHVDFSVTWRWHLITDPRSPPRAVFMFDQNRYELYASAPPGSDTYTAWWVEPYRGVTLTPYDKESDPNPLSLLLASERDGYLPVYFMPDFPEITFGGKEASSMFVDSPVAPEPILYYSRAVLVPQVSGNQPDVNTVKGDGD
jgi:hypothetical protein